MKYFEPYHYFAPLCNKYIYHKYETTFNIIIIIVYTNNKRNHTNSQVHTYIHSWANHQWRLRPSSGAEAAVRQLASLTAVVRTNREEQAFGRSRYWQSTIDNRHRHRQTVVCVAASRMPFVLLLFQIVAGLTLILFVIHYIYYIINAIAGDLQLQQQLQQQQQQILQLQQNVYLQQLQQPSVKNYRQQRIPVASSATYRKSHCFTATATATTTTGEKMQTSDDAKFIKK